MTKISISVGPIVFQTLPLSCQIPKPPSLHVIPPKNPPSPLSNLLRRAAELDAPRWTAASLKHARAGTSGFVDADGLRAPGRRADMLTSLSSPS